MSSTRDIHKAREERGWLLARYDTEKMPNSIYSVIKRLECDISWPQFRLREKTLTRAIQDAYSIRKS